MPPKVAAGQNLMGIALVTHIEYQPVAVGMENAMNGDNDFNCA